MQSQTLEHRAAVSEHANEHLWSRRHLLQSASLAMGAGMLPAAQSTVAANARAAALPPGKMVAAIEGRFHVVEQGAGPAVLFCHGFPDTAATWRSQMQAVAEAGYRAIALDMRGYGRSYAPESPDLYTALHVTGDLVGILDALSIDRAVIVGHDWGAFHSQLAALMRPDRYRALVSISIPFAPRGKVDPWQILRSEPSLSRYYAFDILAPGTEAKFANAAETIPSILYWLSGSPDPALRWDPLDPKLHMLRASPTPVPAWADPAYVRHTIDAFQRTGFRGGLNYYRAFSKTFALTPAFTGAVIQQPSLYIWGTADGLCRMMHPEPPTLAALRITQPRLVGQVRIENAGHWLQHEAADQVNGALIKFLGDL